MATKYWLFPPLSYFPTRLQPPPLTPLSSLPISVFPISVLECTMVQIRKKHNKNSHLIIHIPKGSGKSELPSEQTRERSGAHKRSKLCRASK